jgi:hypothetical protein
MKQGQSSINVIKKKWEESSQYLTYLREVLHGKDVRKNLIDEYSRLRRVPIVKTSGVAGHHYGERMIWYDLAMFREVGPIGIMAGPTVHTLFDQKEESLRARVYSLIPKLPYNTLSDFRDFVLLTARLIERISYICLMATIQFLEREKGVTRESCDIRVYTDYFTSKLFWETEVLYELRHEKSMNNFCTKYDEWLCDKLLTPEVVG